jgi:diguanylate cyclase (GGDEF)-like protein
VLEAEEKLDHAMRQSQQLARDRTRRFGWVGMTAASYLADTAFLALFCVAGTVPARVPVVFGAGAAAIVAVHYWAYASGWSLKLRDPNFVLPTMVASFAMQLGVFALAPQLAFPLLANLFTVFAFGAIWLSVRASVVAWAVGAGLTGIVMFAVAERAGMPTGTLFERTLVWLFFTLILGRFVLLSANASAMRTRLYDSRRKLAQSLAQVQELVRFDDLTRALNRRSLIARLEQERSRAERTGSPFSVALLDLDHFKAINDTHGHAAGDEVLKAFAATVQESMRDADVFGRYGGEEFLLILVATPSDSALNPVERVRSAVARREWGAIAPGVALTVSVGVAGYSSGDTVAQLLHRADVVLYEAKRTGRDRVVVA